MHSKIGAMNRRHFAALPILVSLAILAAPLALYVWAYFGLCVTYEWKNNKGEYSIERFYHYEWLETAFEPAAWIEGKLRGCPIDTL
jgi:hypothetical protein